MVMSIRCDMLTQDLWQARTHRHVLYNSDSKLHNSRVIHAHKHGVRARLMAWIHPVPTAMNAAQWATQDTPVLARKTLLLQSGRALLTGMREWLNEDKFTCPLCGADSTAMAITGHVVADCQILATVRTSALSDMLQILKTKDPNSPPEASARVAVPVPRELRELVADSAAQPQVRTEHRDNLIRLLLCGQWPALTPTG